uniref:Uncharacterized protein n=1 Tax=Canis lupus familiaris TaxID=9615 RepID=A0A8P0TH18_CANLF
MARWNAHNHSITAEGPYHDLAIMGYMDLPSIRATLWEKPSSTSCQLRSAPWVVKTGQVFLFVCFVFFVNGLTPRNQKCSVIRDSLLQGREFTVDLPTKSTHRAPTSITVTRTAKMLDPCFDW